MLGNEWVFGYEGQGGFLYWAFGISRIGAPIILLLAAIGMGAFNFHRHWIRAALIILCLLFVGALYYLHPLYKGDMVDDYRNFRNTTSMFILAGLCCLVGYHIGSSPPTAQWLLERWAIFLTIVAIYELIIRFTTLDKIYFYLEPMWPIRIFLIFPVCWYLHEILSGSRIRIWSVIAFLASTLNIVIAFHKPIIGSMIVSTIVLFAFEIKRGGNVRTIFRFAILAVVGVIGFTVVDNYTSGEISGLAQKIISKKFLHEGRHDAAGSLWETIDKASGGRLEMWNDALIKFAESPIIGYGPDQTVLLSRTDLPLHNTYLESLLVLGLLGSAPFFIGIVWWFCRVLNKQALLLQGNLIIPCVACAFAFLFFSFIGVSTMFNTMIPFCVALMSVSFALAEQARLNCEAKTIRPLLGKASNQSLMTARLPQPGKIIPPKQ
jgi:O-antigen ligase